MVTAKDIDENGNLILNQVVQHDEGDDNDEDEDNNEEEDNDKKTND